MTSHDLLQAAMRQDFFIFVKRVFRELAPGTVFEENWSVEAICYALQELGEGRCRRQIVALPPRSLKSICASVALPAWLLGRDPSLKIITVSYSQELADKLSADCRQVMKSAWYKELFPGTTLSSNKDTESYYRTTANGFRYATSVSGTLTGMGGDLVIIDDPGKPGEVMSRATREAINAWYGRTLVSRLDNKLTGRILLVMQRLHLNDLVGHVQEHENWDTLTIPAIAESDWVYLLGPKRVHHRRTGEVLRPASEPREVLEQQREIMGEYAFSAQYQQRPIPLEGSLVKLAWFKRYQAGTHPKHPNSNIILSFDTATKIGPSNDYSVCIVAAVVQEKIYIIDVWRERVDFPSLHRAVLRLGQRYSPQHILIEDVGAGTSLRQQLREGPLAGAPSITGIKPLDDKVTRLATVSPQIERGDILLPDAAPWLDSFLDELAQFPQGSHDDQVDTFSQLLAWNAKRLTYTAVRVPMFHYGNRPKPKKDWDWSAVM